ncbi:hypothetical protein M3223_19720 [Paenibacillus pasadenensis]|uniref:hypothetical protein n=1 Tax=Paenibacillus pasadenensis TaxID=217090 RepID=UPI00203BB0AB|nr:hypothetical protein [Paenibacillus pasadenensis]MCM3749584.1 hypothetical protein [Paenibacillus pasadenensis]
MFQLLDARTSTNIPLGGFLFPTSTFLFENPTLAGQIGLNVPPDTQGVIRVKLEGQVGVYIVEENLFSPLVQVTIVRGEEATDPLVSTTIVQFQPSETGVKNIAIEAADFEVSAPASGVLIYTMFVTSLSEDVGRSGPECLTGVAVTG